MKMTIEKCDNGFIVTCEGDNPPIKRCFNSLEFAMDEILFRYEGRSRNYIGAGGPKALGLGTGHNPPPGGYGEVVIMRRKEGPEGQRAQAVPV